MAAEPGIRRALQSGCVLELGRKSRPRPNPFPDGILEPPGSSLGALTFLGRGPGFSNPDFVVANVHQFSIGVQRELPWQIALDVSYVGSRTDDMSRSGTVSNEPSLEFVRQCDVTQKGSRSVCDALLPNPFFGVDAFEGTTRFTNPTLSRFELNRPFPAFTGINMTETNQSNFQPFIQLGFRLTF